MKCIVKGYIKLPYQYTEQIDDQQKIIEEEKGGFKEDWKNGELWAYLDIENHKVIDADFNIIKLISRIGKSDV